LASAAAILQARQLTRAVSRAEIRNCVLLDSQAKVLEYCRRLLAKTRHEEFHALFLDRRGELQGAECMQRGTIDHVCVYPRELLKQTIRHHASFIILVHNHPYGKATPSRADIAMTRQLSSLVGPIGAQVFDHIIISPDGVFSFRTKALLPDGNETGSSASLEQCPT
jgi:DNA repair protein RadC